MTPYLKNVNGKSVLMVQEKPFVMLAGEAQNSSSSSLSYMEHVWDKADTLGLNCVLLPITWELLEPEEGTFDFHLVDGLITQARKHGKKIVFLWFGAWKNAQCYYAPAWVKTNLTRFKRAQVEKGKNHTNLKNFHGMPYSTLSYLCEETNKADKKAFCALLKHIKQVDEAEHTVVMVQVENEPGLQGAARENSDEADAVFAADVPQGFADYMKKSTVTMAEDVRAEVENGAQSGSWSAVFGKAAEEIFSAYHVAGYIEKLAAAGKSIYPVPMLVNCWLDKGQPAGQYPSGGPVARMMEVWKYCAPSIDVLAPDIYLQNFCGVCDEYVKLDNPLLIPETATHSYAGPRLVYVVGHYHALGFAPFGFEDLGEEFSAIESYLFGVDTEDPALKTPQDTSEYSWYCNTLNAMLPLLAEKYGTGSLQAVSSERKDEDTMMFGKFGFKAMMQPPMVQRTDGVCLALQVAEDEFYVIANGCMLVPFSMDTQNPHLDILSLEEGDFENGEWHAQRRLNGDEVAAQRYNKPSLLKIKLFAYN